MGTDHPLRRGPHRPSRVLAKVQLDLILGENTARLLGIPGQPDLASLPGGLLYHPGDMSDIDLGAHGGAPREPTAREASDPAADPVRDVRSLVAPDGRTHRLRKPVTAGTRRW